MDGLLWRDAAALVRLHGLVPNAPLAFTTKIPVGVADRVVVCQPVSASDLSWPSPLITELPEPGRLDRRRVAALAGLAPIARDSGNVGRRTIAGGCPVVRMRLCIAALHACATRFERRAPKVETDLVPRDDDVRRRVADGDGSRGRDWRTEGRSLDAADGAAERVSGTGLGDAGEPARSGDPQAAEGQPLRRALRSRGERR